jgi:hypothetical protein
MSEQNYPSGPWTGFYTYNLLTGKHRMDLTLTFSNGSISGDGADAVGLFIIAGRYDVAAGECHWTKTYVGAHDVFYRGFREGKGIWGLWEIRSWWRGGFHIWPLGEAEAEEFEMEAEETAPVKAIGIVTRVAGG